VKLALLVAVLSVLACAGRADAACTISTTPISFAAYNVFTTSATAANGTITYRCSNNDHNITVAISTGSSGAFSNRTLKKGTENLTYNLYLDAAFTSIWGDGSGGTVSYHIGNPPNGVDVNLTVYGRVPALQDVSAGSYTDTVIATVIF
jgi:spore coat protein U domain-containing protein, fimbrial subunit CupE1/2/3/6